MFFFNKSKPILKDLIPDNYVDIHSHLLFGIDDGAKTPEDSLQLIESLKSFGVNEFITTPHIIQHIWENDPTIIQNREKDLKTILMDNKNDVSLRAAAEYLMDDHFVKTFQSEKLLTLKDNYVLVEMSYINAPIQLYDILFDLQVAGYKPVLAHPERYMFYHNNFDEYLKLKRAGCQFQLNLLSLVGYYGKPVFDTAKKLLSNGLIDFTGTDTHHNKHINAYSNKVEIKDLAPIKEALSNNQFFKL